MHQPRSGGSLFALASALVLLAGALLPWGASDPGGQVVPALQLALGTAATVIVVAAVLAVWSLRSSSWLGLVCMIVAFVSMVAMLDVSVQVHASGFVPGFGIFVVFSGALLSMVAAALEGIERDMADVEGLA